MFEKILSKFIAIFLYLGALMFFLAFIGSLLEDTFSKLVSFVLLVISCVFIYFGQKLWKITKSEINHSNYSRVNNQTEKSLTTDVPHEVLKEMKKYYSRIQLLDDIRILQESIELMKSTKNIETFLSRSDLAQRTALTIEQAIMVGIRVKEQFTSSKEVINLKIELLPKLLDESYLKMKQNASKLKTEKGKIGRYQKYLEMLQEYEYELDLSENFEDIISGVKQEINQLSHSYK